MSSKEKKTMTLYQMLTVAQIFFQSPFHGQSFNSTVFVRNSSLVTDMPHRRFCIDLYSRGNGPKFSYHAWKHGNYPNTPQTCLLEDSASSSYIASPSLSSDMDITFSTLISYSGSRPKYNNFFSFTLQYLVKGRLTYFLGWR